MLFPIEDRTAEGSQDIYLLYESFNNDGQGVITVVASIKPWCKEWRVYWMAFEYEGSSPDSRYEICKRWGNKVDHDVARAMFPTVEDEYSVRWKL